MPNAPPLPTSLQTTPPQTSPLQASPQIIQASPRSPTPPYVPPHLRQVSTPFPESSQQNLLLFSLQQSSKAVPVAEISMTRGANKPVKISQYW